jgi:hypothetical protein
LEKVGIRDFIDIVYSYAINSPEMRHDFRTAFLGYAFDYKVGRAAEEDLTFEGFERSALDMLDELDAFSQELG